jgi:hypothetical protein
MVYGSTVLPTFASTLNGLANGDQASVSLSTTATAYNGQAGSASPVGSYPITAATVNSANYSVASSTILGYLAVTQATLNIQANTQGGTGSPIVYGTPTILATDKSAFTTSGLVNGDYVNTVPIVFSGTGGSGTANISGATPAGNYNGQLTFDKTLVTGSGLSNYNIVPAAGNLIITPAKLTVTAVNDAKLIGTSDTSTSSTYAGVIFSGFKNSDTPSTLNLTGLQISRSNAGVNNTTDPVGFYSGVLVPTLNSSSLNGSLNSNYTYSYVNGNYSILPAGTLLVRVTSDPVRYGAGITYANPTASYLALGSSAPTSLSAQIDPNNANNIIVTGLGSNTVLANVSLAIGSPQYSGSNNLNVGSYNLLNSTSSSAISAQNPNPSTINTSAFSNIVTIGGVSILPQVIQLSSLNISGVTKVYDGLLSMSGLAVAPATSPFLARDNVSLSAAGSFADKNVGSGNKAYTVGISLTGNLIGNDSNNYVISDGGLTNGTNGTIVPLPSVTYVGSTTGGAWSDPNSWRATPGTVVAGLTLSNAVGAIPDATLQNGDIVNNVTNIVIPVGSTVVYDTGMSTTAKITSNIANSGTVTFGSGSIVDSTLDIGMAISGAGSVTITGPGKVSLSGNNNSYTGNFVIGSGSTLIVPTPQAIGASGNIQGAGGSLQITSSGALGQINASGTLRLLSNVTTTGNQTWGNLTITQSPLTTLKSINGSIIFNGTLDGSTTNNSLLVLTPNGSATFNNSVGSTMPLNVLEVDSTRTNINADILTSNQQNYCGPTGCYIALTTTQVNNSYCATGDCYSVDSSLAYNLMSAGPYSTANYALNTNSAQVFIGDNGQVGFLYNTYANYATKAFGGTAPLFQNNAVFARTLISRDPMVNFGGFINDASAASTHTLQAAAIKVNTAEAAPSVVFGNSVGGSKPLFSINALTQIINASNAMDGLIKFANGISLTSQSNMSFGSNIIKPDGVSFRAIDTNASINFVVPVNTGTFTLTGVSINANYVSRNGVVTRSLAGATIGNSLSGGIPSTSTARAPVTTAPTSSSRNGVIMASVSQQTKLERKYSVEASVDVGDIEMDDRPADKEKDEEERKKKKGGKTT